MGRLQFKNVATGEKAAAVIKDISFAAEEGDLVVLLGPSGSGKSEILRLAAGLEKVAAGEVILDGVLVNDVPPSERNVAMVFQDISLYPHMNVADNLAFGLRMHGVKRQKREKKVDHIAEILGLKHLLHKFPRELTTARKKRVAMGKALVRKPKAFLLDEPLVNLDAKARSHMSTEVKRVHERLKATTLYATTDPQEAMTIATRIVVLHRGRLQQIGMPHTIYYKPANMFVAGYVGVPPMNFIRCRNSNEAQGWARERWGGEKFDATNVVLGIRPDCFVAESDKTTQGMMPLILHVNVIEPLGSFVKITGTFGDQKVTAVLSAHEIDVEKGPLQLWFDIHETHLFDAYSGRRLG